MMTTQSSPATTLSTLPGWIFEVHRRLLARYAALSACRRTIAVLSGLHDEALHDIGIKRYEIRQIAQRLVAQYSFGDVRLR